MQLALLLPTIPDTWCKGSVESQHSMPRVRLAGLKGAACYLPWMGWPNHVCGTGRVHVKPGGWQKETLQ